MDGKLSGILVLWSVLFLMAESHPFIEPVGDIILDGPVVINKTDDAPRKIVQMKDVATKDVPMTDVLMKDVPTKDGPTRDVPTKDGPMKNNVTAASSTTPMNPVVRKENKTIPSAPSTEIPVKDKSDRSRFWPQGIIHYNIRKEEFTQEEITAMEDAMVLWIRYTCVTFRPGKTAAPDFITFQKGSSCDSKVGKQGGEQIIQIADGCTSKSGMVKVLGRAIGYDYNSQPRQSMDDVVAAVDDNDGDENLLTFDEIKYVSKSYHCHVTSLNGLCWTSDESCPRDGFLAKDCSCWCPGNAWDVYKLCTIQS